MATDEKRQEILEKLRNAVSQYDEDSAKENATEALDSGLDANDAIYGLSPRTYVFHLGGWPLWELFEKFSDVNWDWSKSTHSPLSSPGTTKLDFTQIFIRPHAYLNLTIESMAIEKLPSSG